MSAVAMVATSVTAIATSITIPTDFLPFLPDMLAVPFMHVPSVLGVCLYPIGDLLRHVVATRVADGKPLPNMCGWHKL